MTTVARLRLSEGFEAFVYVAPDQKDVGLGVKNSIAKLGFNLVIGAQADKAQDLHPTGYFRLDFDLDEFGIIVPWLMINRQKLSVLIVPKTKNRRADFKKHALWLGTPLPFDVSYLK